MATNSKKNEKTVKELLDAQEKVNIYVPTAGDDDYPFCEVYVNGYPYRFKKDEDVEVPATVAEIVRASIKNLRKVKSDYADMTVGAGRDIGKGAPNVIADASDDEE